ncbi:uncharacterized protein DEA37_0002491, partial [Paragonimus westermani]
NATQPSNLPWATPVVLVKRNGGKLHLCVDCWPLNCVTKRGSFHLPRANDVLDAQLGLRWFSTLNLGPG